MLYRNLFLFRLKVDNVSYKGTLKRRDYSSSISSITAKMRNDYFEFAAISLLFLGGAMPEERKASPIHAPGAHHHARWMSKVIFTIKIALFQDQLTDFYSEEHLTMITSLAVFLATFYSKMWLLSTNSADAAQNDLCTVGCESFDPQWRLPAHLPAVSL